MISPAYYPALKLITFLGLTRHLPSHASAEILRSEILPRSRRQARPRLSPLEALRHIPLLPRPLVLRPHHQRPTFETRLPPP